MNSEFLEMSWEFSDDGNSLVKFENKSLVQEITISKRQLFAFLKVISMSNPTIPHNNYNIGSWLLGFNIGKFNADCFQTTQKNSHQKEGLNQQN